MKLLAVCPAATVTIEGTLRLALLLESATAKPPTAAAPVSETVQEVLPGVLMVELVQLTLLSVGNDTGREMAPVFPVAGIEVPPAVVAIAPVS